MKVLNQNHAAPLSIFECPKCMTAFVAKGVNLQLCPHCGEADIISIERAAYSAVITPDARACKFCHLIHDPLDPPLKCLDGVEEHYFEPLPKEILACLSVEASESASSKESTGSKPEDATS